MPPHNQLEDLRRLRESVAVECKLAGGRDGQGAVPEDFWATYSAFANTQGGVMEDLHDGQPARVKNRTVTSLINIHRPPQQPELPHAA